MDLWLMEARSLEVFFSVLVALFPPSNSSSLISDANKHFSQGWLRKARNMIGQGRGQGIGENIKQ